MRYSLKAYTIWEYGQRKDANGNPHQEDSMFPTVENLNENDRLFVLCDGMGGHDAGEVASSTVCEAMGQSILNAVPDSQGFFSDEILLQAVDDAFSALDAKDTGALKKMGTTMTMLKLHDHGYTIAHMGDSRVYHIRPGETPGESRIVFVTRDHSLVNDLIKIGELTEEEAKHSRQKNVITRAMQPNVEHRPRPDIYNSVDVKPGDYFYLCSDGMLEDMEDQELCEIFASHKTNEEKVAELIEKTINNRDNHTAFIIEITDVIDPLPIPEPHHIELHNDENTQHAFSAPIADVDGCAPVANPSTPRYAPAQMAAPMPGPAPKAAPTPAPIPLPEPNNKTKTLWAVVIVLSLALLLVLGFMFIGDEKAENQQIDDNVNEKVENAIKNGTEDRRSGGTPEITPPPTRRDEQAETPRQIPINQRVNINGEEEVTDKIEDKTAPNAPENPNRTNDKENRATQNEVGAQQNPAAALGGNVTGPQIGTGNKTSGTAKTDNPSEKPDSNTQHVDTVIKNTI